MAVRITTGYLCPKDVGSRLGVSTRTAQRLMLSNTIESFRVGRKLLRTTEAKVGQYVAGEFARYRRAPRRAA